MTKKFVRRIFFKDKEYQRSKNGDKVRTFETLNWKYGFQKTVEPRSHRKTDSDFVIDT